MDNTTIKQRKTSPKKGQYEYDDSDEEAAYNSSSNPQGSSIFNSDGFNMDSKQILHQISAPSTFVIFMLVAVLVLLSYEFGNLQHQINALHKENKEQVVVEGRLKEELKVLKKEVKGVEHEEVHLMQMENLLEAKEKKLERKSHGHGALGDTEEIELHPLTKHRATHGNDFN